MSKIIQPITACFKKGQIMDKKEDNSKEKSLHDHEGSNNNATQDSGLLWRMSSGLYSVGSSAVGLGIGSVKWAASTTYSVGTGVVSTAASVGTGVVSTAASAVGSGVVKKVVSKVIPSAIPKPKKE